MSAIEGAEPFDFSADFFDSRDVIARIAYLELTDPIDREEEEQEELDDLYALQEEAGDSGYVPDWKYGETFIADSYFEDYARQLAEDIGAINPDAGWPYGHIDWEAAAESLQQDYTEFTLRGTVYWAR